MDWDEPKAKSPSDMKIGDDLSNLSIAELDERVARLKAEILRIEATAASKKQHSAAADAFFGGGKAKD